MRGRVAVGLADGERKQCCNGSPSGETLENADAEAKVLASCQDKVSWQRIFVDRDLNGGEGFWCALEFIKDGTILDPVYESNGVGDGLVPFGGGFTIDVGKRRKKRAAKSRLARLSWSG